MKRCWFGSGLLTALLLGSICVSWYMDRIHEPIVSDLKQASECAELGDWINAELFSRKAERNWEKWAHFRNCFADHSPTEEIKGELAAMATARQEQETADFAASCARAAEMVQAVADAHALRWWNLL